MKRSAFLLSLLCLFTTPSPGATKPKVVDAYAKLPLSFEANQGQSDARVKFLSRGSGYSLFLTSSEAVLLLQKGAPSGGSVKQHGRARIDEPVPPQNLNREDDAGAKSAVLRIRLVGANPAPLLTGFDELPGKANYFIGNDPKKWRTDVPTYAKVKYHAVYRGVDLVYYGNQRQLEHDFIVAPGADPRAITLRMEGAEKLSVDGKDDLVVKTENGEVRFEKPMVYQEVDGVRQEVAGGYKLKGKNRVGFEVTTYDVTKPLVIDPALVYSTYLGGSDFDRGFGIALDSAGSAYVTGETCSTNFPTANPIQAENATLPATGECKDAFVTKLNAAGSALVYSTYLGGNGYDAGFAISVDPASNAYVTGETCSSNFPTASPFQAFPGQGCDAFVTKLNTAGDALVYSTYLGGNSEEAGFGIAVDSLGSAYVTGRTSSTNGGVPFPTTSGSFQTNNAGCASGDCYDAFVTKFNATGNALVYSTYLGGGGGDYIFLGGSATEMGTGIAVDSTGSAYVTGLTCSTNFPTISPMQTVQGGACDAFLTKLNAAGSALGYSTYLGGSGFDVGKSIAVDSGGNAYVAGYTNGSFPTTAGASQTAYGGGGDDAFVAKLSADGSSLVYATYLGGSGVDAGSGIAVDSSGNAHVAGYTNGSFPTTAGASQTAYGGGGYDAFVTKLSADASSLVYSTYLGGSGDEVDLGIGLDSNGKIYVVGYTNGSFPTTTGAFQATYGGGTYDAFVTKMTVIDLKAFVQQPINPDGTSVFNASRGVIRVRFTLTLNGAATCQLPPATISLTRTAGGTIGPIDESVYESAADTGSNFRISGCQYGYNIAASSLGIGTYRVDISINGDVVGSGIFGLK